MDEPTLADNVSGAHGDDPALLIEVLHDIQSARGWIEAAEDIPVLARRLNRSRAEIHGVITFYSDFRREKPELPSVQVCRGEACQSVGADQLLARLREDYPNRVEAMEVFCLGNCALGPCIAQGELVYGLVDKQRLDEVVGGAK